MELTGVLLRFAADRPHVLLIELPGGTAARLAAEVELRRRDWPPAASPAEADVVVLAGPVPAALTAMVGRMWRAVPKPRVYVNAEHASQIPERLDDARGLLASGGESWEAFTGEEPDVDSAVDHHGGGHDDGGGMAMPGGLDMAGRGADRDGLALDQLHVPLGPLLPEWPAGVVVQTTLQGDVIQDASVEIVGEHAAANDFWNEPRVRADAGNETTRGACARRAVASYLDGLTRLVTLAGWPGPAADAARLRDELLAGTGAEQLALRLRRLRRRLHRARTLRWLTDDLGVLPLERAESVGLGGPALYASRFGGDVTARWMAWLAAAERMLPTIDEAALLSVEGLRRSRDDPRAAPALAVLPELLVGTELAGARLIVASLAPDISTRLVPETIGGGR